MSIVAWAAKRQIQALHDAVAWSLGFVLNPNNQSNMPAKEINEPLYNHGLDCADEEADYLFEFGSFMDSYIQNKGNLSTIEHKASSSISDASFDFGEERAGATWYELDNFIITSAFVRLLGSIETFELDMLKALLHYRPLGLIGPEQEQIEATVEEFVILEEPEIEKVKGSKREYYSYPPIWTWMRKSAYSNVERRRILTNVYKFGNVDDYKNAQIDDWYEKRNAIAHGRAAVKMTLKDYCDVEIYALKAVQHYEKECKTKMRLVI